MHCTGLMMFSDPSKEKKNPFSLSPDSLLSTKISLVVEKMGAVGIPSRSTADNPQSRGSSNYGAGDPSVICIHFTSVYLLVVRKQR